MLDTVKINHVQHISFTQSRLTDAVSVILSELLSYEHPSKLRAAFYMSRARRLIHGGGDVLLAVQGVVEHGVPQGQQLPVLL